MRLWHKDLISVLPDKQLVGQWRECCAIARNIKVNGTPNHILVNRIMNYPMDHFYWYSEKVYIEMINRGYKCNWTKFTKWIPTTVHIIPSEYELFKGWHNRRYLLQCLFNLQEKYDCGGISYKDWEVLADSKFN